MLTEYALGSCIFDTTCFSDSEKCGIYLKNLKGILINDEALVRDLHDGSWSKYVKNIQSKHPNTKYILQSLGKQLRRVKAADNNVPVSHLDWCNEALKSHRNESLNGIIVSKDIVKIFTGEGLVASIESLDKTPWWENRSPSINIERRTNEYLHHLKRVYSHANSIMFIDPYIDPVQHDYREFYHLLARIPNRDIPPLIQIHMCHLKNTTITGYEQDFRSKLTNVIQSAKLTVEVFIWDKFHNRYLISNFIGINLPYGFSISDIPNEKTIWTRIGRNDRDDIQREFDQASGRHKLQHRFTVS